MKLSPLLFFLLLGACTTVQIPPPTPTPPVVESKPVEAIPPSIYQPPTLKPGDWQSLPGWSVDDLLPAWDAFLQSCTAIKKQPQWLSVCEQAALLQSPKEAMLREFFEKKFLPHQLINADGSDEGLITGYYEPLLKGSRKPTARYRFPIYAAPEDLLVVELGEVYPELKNMRLRGRLQGKKVLPYYSRAEIENGAAPPSEKILLWVEDAVELFFLQIQGSGRVQLENGEVVRVGYAEQNGHPYKSIGKLLVARGELPLAQASMQGIKTWGQKNQSKLVELLKQNPSFVFFRELPADASDPSGKLGPPGSLGVPLTAGRSIAIDPRALPQGMGLGAPVFLSTTWPNTELPLNRLMLAQDTGGAIKGGIRADFFWGFGEAAGNQAGKMKQRGKMWVLLPQ